MPAYRVEIIKKPYMNNSMLLTINGKPKTFSSRRNAELFVVEYLGGIPYQIWGDDYHMFESKDEKMVFVISDVKERTFADRHEKNASLEKYANFIDKPLKGYRHKTHHAKHHKKCFCQLKDAYKKML